MSTDRQREAAIALARASFQLGAAEPRTVQELRAGIAVVKWARALGIEPDELLVLFCAEEVLKRTPRND